VLPEVAFDACESQDDWLSKLNTRQYHAVLSDVRSAEAEHYLLLRRAQELWCPVPVVLAKGTGDYQAVRRALTHGALDMIPSPPTGCFENYQACLVALSDAADHLRSQATVEPIPPSRSTGSNHVDSA